MRFFFEAVGAFPGVGASMPRGLVAAACGGAARQRAVGATVQEEFQSFVKERVQLLLEHVGVKEAKWVIFGLFPPGARFSLLSWGKASYLNSTNKKRVPFFHGYWASEFRTVFCLCMLLFSIFSANDASGGGVRDIDMIETDPYWTCEAPNMPLVSRLLLEARQRIG